MKKLLFVIFSCFLISGCPFDRVCGPFGDTVAFLNLGAHPLYLKEETATETRFYTIHYGQTFYLIYQMNWSQCSGFSIPSAQLIKQMEDKINSSIYSFYDASTMNTPLFSITAKELKTFSSQQLENQSASIHQAVFYQNKLQYLTKEEANTLQPLTWKKRDGYLEYGSLLFSVAHSPCHSEKACEVSFKFSRINALFLFSFSDHHYTFDPSAVYVLQNGKKIPLKPKYGTKQKRPIVSKKQRFWQQDEFVFILPDTPFDNNKIYVEGIQFDGKDLETYIFTQIGK